VTLKSSTITTAVVVSAFRPSAAFVFDAYAPRFPSASG
jgi:hypothetical protein